MLGEGRAGLLASTSSFSVSGGAVGGGGGEGGVVEELWDELFPDPWPIPPDNRRSFPRYNALVVSVMGPA